QVVIANVVATGYNGTFTITVTGPNTFTYTAGSSGLANSGGGTVTASSTVDTSANGGATEIGTTATIKTTTPHGYLPGQSVTIASVGAAGNNSNFLTLPVPSATASTTK